MPLTLYCFDKNGIYSGTKNARINPSRPKNPDGSDNYLMPKDSTILPVPSVVGAGKIPKWDGGSWSLVDDVYGKTIYSTSDKSPSTLKGYEVPTGYTLKTPSQFSKWNESLQEWVYDKDAHEQQVRKLRDAKLFSCDWTQLADSPLTYEKKEEWKEYRQKLRDYLSTDFTSGVWPVEPE